MHTDNTIVEKAFYQTVLFKPKSGTKITNNYIIFLTLVTLAAGLFIYLLMMVFQNKLLIDALNSYR